MTQTTTPDMLNTGEILAVVDGATASIEQEGILRDRLTYCDYVLDRWMASYSADGSRILPENMNEQVQLVQFNIGAVARSEDPETQAALPDLINTFHHLVEGAPAVSDSDLSAALMLLQDHPALQTQLLARSLGDESAEIWSGQEAPGISEESVLIGWMKSRYVAEGRLPSPVTDPSLEFELEELENARRRSLLPTQISD